MLGLYLDNGKENGNYRDYRDSIEIHASPDMYVYTHGKFMGTSMYLSI